MSEDPYAVLGVERTADQAEIKKAYRRLAKSLHPDLHPDDPAKQSAFQAVSAAYDLLGDAEKRRRFDAGEIDASGHERAEPQFYHHYAGGEAGRRYDPGSGMSEDEMSDLFADLFGGRGGGFRQEVHARGADARYHVEVDFLDAARGARRAFTMPDGKRIEIAIPPGLRDGQILRLRGKGGPGHGRGEAGDALVTVAVRPHPTFTRNGNDVEVEVPITVDEAVLGREDRGADDFGSGGDDRAGGVQLGAAPAAAGAGDQERGGHRRPGRPAAHRPARADRRCHARPGPALAGHGRLRSARRSGEGDMTLDERMVVAEVSRLTLRELRLWVREGWVRPAQGEGGPVFDEVDVARIRLLCDLRKDMSLPAEALPVVLGLLDRLHAARRDLRCLAEALDEQPEEVRARVIAAARRRPGAGV